MTVPREQKSSPNQGRNGAVILKVPQNGWPEYKCADVDHLEMRMPTSLKVLMPKDDESQTGAQ
jgi:hypothetical protein